MVKIAKKGHSSAADERSSVANEDSSATDEGFSSADEGFFAAEKCSSASDEGSALSDESSSGAAERSSGADERSSEASQSLFVAVRCVFSSLPFDLFVPSLRERALAGSDGLRYFAPMTVRLTGAGQIPVPEELRVRLDLHPGQEIEVRAEQDKLVAFKKGGRETADFRVLMARLDYVRAGRRFGRDEANER